MHKYSTKMMTQAHNNLFKLSNKTRQNLSMITNFKDAMIRYMKSLTVLNKYNNYQRVILTKKKKIKLDYSPRF